MLTTFHDQFNKNNCYWDADKVQRGDRCKALGYLTLGRFTRWLGTESGRQVTGVDCSHAGRNAEREQRVRRIAMEFFALAVRLSKECEIRRGDVDGGARSARSTLAPSASFRASRRRCSRTSCATCRPLRPPRRPPSRPLPRRQRRMLSSLLAGSNPLSSPLANMNPLSSPLANTSLACSSPRQLHSPRLRSRQVVDRAVADLRPESPKAARPLAKTREA